MNNIVYAPHPAHGTLHTAGAPFPKYRKLTVLFKEVIDAYEKDGSIARFIYVNPKHYRFIKDLLRISTFTVLACDSIPMQCFHLSPDDAALFGGEVSLEDYSQLQYRSAIGKLVRGIWKTADTNEVASLLRVHRHELERIAEREQKNITALVIHDQPLSDEIRTVIYELGFTVFTTDELIYEEFIVGKFKDKE